MSKSTLAEYFTKFSELEAKRLSGGTLTDKEALLLNHLRAVLEHNTKYGIKNSQFFKPVEEKKLELTKEIKLSFKDIEEFRKSYAYNIVGGGLYLKSKNPMPLGYKLTLNITIENLKFNTEITAEVVWSTGKIKKEEEGENLKTYAVKFIDLSDSVRKKIEFFVGTKLGVNNKEIAKNQVKSKNHKRSKESEDELSEIEALYSGEISEEDDGFNTDEFISIHRTQIKKNKKSWLKSLLGFD